MTIWNYNPELLDGEWIQRILTGYVPSIIQKIETCAQDILIQLENPCPSIIEHPNHEWNYLIQYEGIPYYIRFWLNMLIVSTDHDYAYSDIYYVPCSMPQLEYFIVDGCQLLTIGQIYSM